MKWTPLWSDPIGWSEQVAKTKLRVFIWAFIHLVVVLLGLYAIYWLSQKAHEFPIDSPGSRTLVWLAFLTGAWPILFIGVAFPSMYLYAIYRLLAALKAERRAQESGDKKDDGR